MAVGGLALHYGGASPRFSPEDFRVRSTYGVGEDWPLSWEELEPLYQEVEERMGVAGEQGPPELDPRSKPYPMSPLPLSYNLKLLKEWGEAGGIPFWTMPQAKNTTSYRGRPVCCRLDTCNMCPIGARYSPDFTFRDLEDAGRIELIPRTMVRRLIPADGSSRVGHAIAVDRDRPDVPVEIRARVFVVASGYIWSSHLLLLSADSRHPEGLANSSGLVGRYLSGHRFVTANAELPMKLYPGLNRRNSLVSKQFMRPGESDSYVRHDLRIWESTSGNDPRLEDEDGGVLLGDEVMDDWRRRAETGTARLRSYYDVFPDRESRLTLDSSARTPWGDPLPRMQFKDSPVSADLRPRTEALIQERFEEMVQAGGGTLGPIRSSDEKDHAGGGCRMGNDPATSVTDSFGRTHDHENLFVVGAPTMVTTGCANSAPTIGALGLRSATKIGEDFPRRA
jgi:quinoprotein glucose dehydrogenase